MSCKNTISTPEQMPSKVTCIKMDQEWKDDIKSHWWSTDFNGTMDNESNKIIAQQLYKVRDKILSFAGEEVCMPFCIDKDTDHILTRGKFFYGDDVILKKGRDSQCHCNSIEIWLANKTTTRIATGYALCEDGMWREHSWIVKLLKTKYKIIETTVKRLAYFGYVMTSEECQEFTEDSSYYF